MKKLALTERDIDRLLSGRQLADGSEDRLAGFFGSARRVLTVPPDEKTETAHLAAMLAAARPQRSATVVPVAKIGRTAAPRALGLRLRAAAAKVAIGALGLTTTTAGLAMAGVDLPGTVAEKAFRAVGITLPNQDHDDAASENASETSDRVREAVRGRDASTSGCEFGASVSRAARGVSEVGDPEHCNPPGHDKAAKKDRTGSGRGDKKRPPGKTKDDPSDGSNSGTGSTPPGRDGTNGKAGDPPGQTNKEHPGGTNPGHGGTNPGQGGTNPGQGGTNPGQGGTNPGQGGTNPGNGGTNPGETKKQGGSGTDSGDDGTNPEGGAPSAAG